MIFIAACLLIVSAKSQPAQPGKDELSVRQFVQSFYDWYAPRVEDDGSHFPPRDYMMVALRTKREMFTPVLRNALVADSFAAEHDPDDPTGLDSEPFLAGQDFPSHYKVGKAIHRGSKWYIDVKGVKEKGWGDNVPSLTAVVEKHRGRYGWRFSNFAYSNDPSDNLLFMLHQLKEEHADNARRRRARKTKTHGH
jgi:hypothetical protein